MFRNVNVRYMCYTSTENNPVVVNWIRKGYAMKANVQVTFEGTLQGLMITKSNLTVKRWSVVSVCLGQNVMCTQSGSARNQSRLYSMPLQM